MRSSIRWHGGKSYQSKHILSLMPAHTRYCEAFFGSGAVLFAKEYEGVAEYVNDRNGTLCHFWSILADPANFAIFRRMVECTPFSQQEFDEAQQRLAGGETPGAWNWDNEIRVAVDFFIINRQSRQGLGKDFATPTTRLRAGMNENVSAWLSAVDGLPEVHERLRRVEIWNEDSITFIDKLDKSYDTLFYLDPPYVLNTRRDNADEYGAFEMSLEDHKRLISYLLRGMRGKVLLSGYPNELYDSELTRERGWRYVDLEIPNHSSSSISKEMKCERLWMNYQA